VRWLRCLQDLRAKAFIQARIERLICGNPGDVPPLEQE
jgi:putative component of toxin-antitoxin plasmid stabilization module